MSAYHLIHNDGRIGTISSGFLGTTVNVEGYSKLFDMTTRRLLLLLADTDMDEETFRKNFESLFTKPVLEKRRQWMAGYQKYLKDLAAANSSFSEKQIKAMAKDLSLG